MKPGIYRGGSPAIFGLWRLREDGVWLFSGTTQGAVWHIASHQTGEGLVRLEGQD